MIRYFLAKLLEENKTMILDEARQLNGFMKLLMKRRNALGDWTKEEKAELKAHLKHLSYYVPALFIFLLPFGSLLIPVLAEILDRRKKMRTNAASPTGAQACTEKNH